LIPKYSLWLAKTVKREEIMTMHIIRWNLMGLALVVLVLNSGLAQADSISSVSPPSVQPGQVVTLHGQFTTENFRSRLYRIMMNKEIAPRPAGAINGVVDSFRVTPTTMMVRIPRTWHGKTVYSGNYAFTIQNVRTHRPVFSGYSTSAHVNISSASRTALGAAKSTALGQIKQHQQQRLGGDIGRAASTHSPYGRGDIGGGIASSAPQMKLTLKDIRVNNRSVFSGGVSLGDRVAATFDIQNLGTAPGSVRVGYLHPDGRVFGNSGTVRILPGGITNVLVNVGINPPPGDRNIHSVRGNDGLWWNPRFALLTTGNNPYRDSYMRDNTHYVSQPIPVSSRNDLAVVSIDGVKLTESWQGGRVEQSYGTVHPVSLEVIIKVKNKGTQNSSPTVMGVTLTGGEPAHSAIERDRHVVRHRAIDCAGPECPLGKNVNIPAIMAGDTVTLRVRFDRIPYHVVRAGNHGASVALGPYICSLNNSISPGHASITAHLQRAAENEAPPLRKDNQLILTGTFTRRDSGYVCGFQNSSSRRISR